MSIISRRVLTASYLFTAFSAAILNGSAPARAQSPAPSQTFVVVVNAANPLEEIDRETLSNLFLKRSAKWPSGSPAQPLDLSLRAQAREDFSRAVLRKSVSAVRNYWQQQIFSGREVPPPEKGSDGDVLVAVKNALEAVGYVSAAATLPAGVKALVVRDKP